jgi:hypothetical protein
LTRKFPVRLTKVNILIGFTNKTLTFDLYSEIMIIAKQNSHVLACGLKQNRGYVTGHGIFTVYKNALNI